MVRKRESIPNQLRALWTLHVTGKVGDASLIDVCDHSSEYMRRWAVTLMLEDNDITDDAHRRLVLMAKNDESPLVRLALASALQRLPIEQRWPIAEGLVSHEEDNEDHNLPLMIWYGIEPAVAADEANALRLASKCKLSKVRQFIAKRVASASGGR